VPARSAAEQCKKCQLLIYHFKYQQFSMEVTGLSRGFISIDTELAGLIDFYSERWWSVAWTYVWFTMTLFSLLALELHLTIYYVYHHINNE
jgi:hypothetical protein